MHGKAGKQRHVQRHAHLALVDAVLDGDGAGAIGVALHAVAGLQIDGGQVAGFGLAGFQLGHVQRQAGLAHQGLLVFGLLHPRGDAGGLQRGQLHRLGQGLGLQRAFAYQLLQRQAFDLQVVGCGNLLRIHQIMAGLGLAGVGDGGGANIEVALGKFQLFLHGALLGLHGGQRVLGGQHIKVALAHAHQQVLRGGVQLGAGQLHIALALAVGDGVGRAEQRLAGLDGRALLVGAVQHAGDVGVHLGAGVVGAGLGAYAGQQAGLGLGTFVLGRIQCRAAGQPGRIEALGQFHHLHQALGAGGGRSQPHGQQGCQGRTVRQGLPEVANHGAPQGGGRVDREKGQRGGWRAVCQ